MTLDEIRAQYPQYDDLTDDELADGIYSQHYSDMPRAEFDKAIGYRDFKARMEEAGKSGVSFQDFFEKEFGRPASAKKKRSEAETAERAKNYKGRNPLVPDALEALTEGSEAGLMMGWDDELSARINSALTGKPYEELQAAADQRKAERRAAYPGSSVAGEITGGLALGGTLSKGGATIAGRDLPVIGRPGAAALEGGVYGAAMGAGEAKPGQRIEGAVRGAVTGAATGVAAHTLGAGLAKRQASGKQAKNAPAVADMQDESQALYKKMRSSGVAVNPKPISDMKKAMDLVLSNTDEDLAGPAFALRRSVEKKMGNGIVYIDELHNLRKQFNRKLKELKPGGEEHYYVMQLRDELDNMLDGLTSNPANLHGGTNPQQALDMWKQAGTLWARSKKTELIEGIIDSADVKTGRYTQSGLANTIRQKMEGLYNQIQSGKVRGFSPQEVELVRQMAKGESAGKTINLLSRFAPRGPVSIVLGQLLGKAFPGGEFAVPLAGQAAGMARDSAALSAAENLRNSAATGLPPIVPGMLPNQGLPFIGGAVAGAESELRGSPPSALLDSLIRQFLPRPASP